MLKKLIPLLLVCLALCACTDPAPEETTLPTPQTQPTGLTEPTGLYDPDSPLEEATQGALRSYPLELEMVYHMEPLGDGVLIFSGSEGTTLTSLAGEGLYIQGQLKLPFWLRNGVSTHVSAKGVCYLDPLTRELVFLDPALKEARRIALPEDLVGDPVLSPDRQTLYYFNADSLRALDLATGIRRLVKQLSYPTMTMEAILLDGAVLQCGVADEAGKWEHLFLDSATGQTLVRTGQNLTLTSAGDTWYASLAAGWMPELLFGTAQGEPSQLTPENITATGYFLPSLHAAAAVDGQALQLYDLAAGTLSAELTLPEEVAPWCITAGSRDVWFLTGMEQTTLCRWDPAASAAAGEGGFVGPRFTAKNPDAQALAQCQALAQSIGEKYGITILLGAEAMALDAPDYLGQMEHSAPIITATLRQLDQVLSWYPADFLEKAMAGSRQPLTVGILRSLTGTPQAGDLGPAAGLQYWRDGSAYLIITPGDDLAGSLCHELCHAMETRVFAESGLFDDWELLNPQGFAYDYDYLANAARDGSAYLQPQTRAFIDTYSMSFPKEDRARVMEYAMQEGMEGYFTSETMQAKLKALCQGIREAFGWKKSDEVFRWEQYLRTE